MCRDITHGQLGNHVRLKFSHRECVHKSRVLQLVPLLWRHQHYTCSNYYGCQRNELTALHERHAIELPPVDERDIYALGRFYRSYRSIPPLVPLTWPELLADVPSNRRRRVQQAWDHNNEGWNERWSEVTAFIKFEKWESDYIGESPEKTMLVKAPRMIQFREKEYTYEWGRYARSFEKMFFYRDNKGRYIANNHRNFSKSMTTWQVAANLRWKYNQFVDPVIIGIDFSTMDATLRWILRETIEWSNYRRAFPRDAWVAYLTRLQGRNKARTVNKLIYFIIGTMMSGEYTTSCGDSEITDAVIAYITRSIKAFWLLNGDDSQTFCERSDLAKVEVDAIAKFGLKAKVDIVYEFEHISYCQSSPVDMGGVWRMVRSPERVMSRSAYTCKRLQGVGWLKLLGAIGLGELSCNTGVPVLQAYSQMLVRAAHGKLSASLLSDYMYMRHDKITDKVQPIKWCTRISFANAFGIPPTEQLSLERTFDTTDLPLLVH